MLLKFDDLKEGEVYTTVSPAAGYTFRKIGPCSDVPYVNYGICLFSHHGHLGKTNTSFEVYKLADNRDYAYFNECLNSGKAISKKDFKFAEVVNDYSVY